VDILKLYHIDNNKENSLNLLLEVVKLVQVMGFNIRKGAKFYRVCYYKKCANYKRMDQLWYPPKPKKDVRITSIEEPVLFIGEHWGSSFLEVFDNSVKKRPFIILELEVTKPFRINYIAPLNLEKHAGASSNNMYMDYCRDCKKIEPKLLALKEEMLRNYLGEFWISNKNFDKLFTYDFTKNISKLLLKRFKGDGLGYLSTQCNYQYNNFAIPASVADECLRPGEVILCDHTFWPNGRGQQPWINFKRIKSGFVDLKTKKIIFTKKYRSDDSYSI
jgi:thiol-disulfide isomerase/thioredoxin